MTDSEVAKPRSRRLKWIGLGLAGLVCVLCVRAAMSSAPEPVTPAAPTIPQVDDTKVAEHLGEVIRQRTISVEPGVVQSSEAFGSLRSTLRGLYPRTFETLQVETIGDHALLLTWEGTEASAAPVLLAAHQDVVPVEPGTEPAWAHEPFGGVIADGFVWGRGAIDCKLGVVGILEAIEALLAQGYRPRRTILVAFGHDEETSGELGAAAIAAVLEQRGVRPFVVLDEGGAMIEGAIPGIERRVGFVGVAEKGYASVRLVATAAGGHSNSPPNRTSIGALSNALARLEASQMDADLQGPTELMLERLAPHASFPMRVVLANLWLFEPLVEWGLTLDPASAATVRTTTAITMFHAGVKDNVLSSKAEAIVNFRIRPGQTVQDVLDHIRDSIDDDEIEIECTSECRDPTPTSDPQSEGFAIIETSIRQVYGDVVVTPYLVVGGTDARYYQAISNHVYRFLPVRLQPEDLQRMHGTDERVAVADAGDAARFYATFIVNASD